MFNPNHRNKVEQAIYDETYNWTIVEWKAFRGQFDNYYELKNRANFDEWKLNAIIDFKVRNFDLRREGTND